MISIMDTPFNPDDALVAFKHPLEDVGAIASFTGIVRNEINHVQGLYLEHYPGVTEQGIAKITAEAHHRWQLIDTLIIHRVGTLKPNEPIVLVAAASTHRRDSFQAVDFLMDFLKSEAMFWKKELRQDGDRWVEPRPEDYQDIKRWK